MHNLALLYKTEYRNYEEAKKSYLVAIKRADARAMFNLTLLNEQNFNAYEEASEHFLMAT